MSNLQQVKRKHVFINKAFQGRFIAGVFALIVLSGLCSALLIYWLTGNELQVQSQTAHVNILTAFERLGLSILIGNVVALILVGVVSVVTVNYATHKIAGPLYRFEKICEQVGEGQFDTVTTLREHDQLQQLGIAFSLMVDKLRARKNQQQIQLEIVTEQIEVIKNDPSLTDNQLKLVEKLASTIKQLA
jgi:methyl-accepting chemotaxis protein